MKRNPTSLILFMALAATVAVSSARAETKPTPEAAPAAKEPTPKKDAADGEPGGKEKPPGERGQERSDARGGPAGQQRIFGEVSAVRGNVLQMRAEEGEGLTRVILAADAQII